MNQNTGVTFRRSFELLLQYLRPHGPRVALLALSLGSSIALQLANPQVVRQFLDTAQAGGAGSDLIRAGGGTPLVELYGPSVG